MEGTIKFDYYYGIEAEQFSFYRIPRLLIKDERFKKLSSDAKLLYGLMLDRMSLSMKNGWLDDSNRAYIIYTIDSIMEDLGCAKATCVKIMKELDSEHGIGLIEKKRRGLGKPDIIYVKNFTVIINEKEESEDINESLQVQEIDFLNSKSNTSRSIKSEPQEVQALKHKKFTGNTLKGLKSGPAEVRNIDPNYTNKSYNNLSYNNSIHQSEGGGMIPQNNRMDTIDAYISIIKNNIDYDHHMKFDDWSVKSLYEELYQIICEIVCVKCDTVKIDGKSIPYELVKPRFLKLNSLHLEYVIECMQKNTTKIRNIKAYMITALYNAPTTVNHYYQQEVLHDTYRDYDESY